MKCLNCNERIEIKRNILNLFSFKKEFICNNCFDKIEFSPNSIPLPINNYNLVVTYLVDDTDKFKYDSLILECSKIYSKLKSYNFLIITFNRFYLCEKSYILLEQLANHHKCNILVYTYEMFD